MTPTLLTVAETAKLLRVSAKTVRRWIALHTLVAHRFNRNTIRVDASSVMRLLADSGVNSDSAVKARTMKKNDNAAGPRLFRQAGKSRCWTGIINGQETPLGTSDREEAERRLWKIASTLPGADRKKGCRVYLDEKGWFLKYYDDSGKRRTHRIPPAEVAKDASQDVAEDYARRWQALRGSEGAIVPAPDVAKACVINASTTLKELGDLWTGGRLAELYPDDVGAKETAEDDKATLTRYVYPLLGSYPVIEFVGERCLELVEPMKAELAKLNLARATRRKPLQCVSRLLNIAVYPLRLIPVNPLPRGFVPSGKSKKAKSWLFPDEDALLMCCPKVPLLQRLLFGFLAREGPRVSEALGFTWSDVDLEHGLVHLDDNKTDDPRSWSLDPGVAEALRRWRSAFAVGAKPSDDVFIDSSGPPDRYTLAENLREGLKAAGVTRPQLFEKSEKRLALRVHDLRATFVTVSLALGKTEAWVTDRTGHRSSQMIYEYKRQARTFAELNLGPLKPLCDAIPELAALAPKSE